MSNQNKWLTGVAIAAAIGGILMLGSPDDFAAVLSILLLVFALFLTIWIWINRRKSSKGEEPFTITAPIRYFFIAAVTSVLSMFIGISEDNSYLYVFSLIAAIVTITFAVKSKNKWLTTLSIILMILLIVVPVILFLVGALKDIATWRP